MLPKTQNLFFSTLLIMLILTAPFMIPISLADNESNVNIYIWVLQGRVVEVWINNQPLIQEIRQYHQELQQVESQVNYLQSIVDTYGEDIRTLKRDVFLLKALIWEMIKLNELQYKLAVKNQEAVNFLQNQVRYLENRKQAETNITTIMKLDNAIKVLNGYIALYKLEAEKMDKAVEQTRFRIIRLYDLLLTPQCGYYDTQGKFHTFNEITLYYPSIFKATACYSNLGDCLVQQGETLTIEGVCYDFYGISISPLKVYIWSPYTGERSITDAKIEKNWLGGYFKITVKIPITEPTGEHFIRIAKTPQFPGFEDSIAIPFTVIPKT